MGYPLRSNIFRSASSERAYFKDFPLQIAVLFSPNDTEFGEAFRESFFHLDQLTGDALAFFAVLDPPRDWLSDAANNRWWREYSEKVGATGFSLNHRVLTKEIARLFGVRWGDLPQIVISTNLWTAEYVRSPTSAAHLQQQLQALTELVRRDDTQQSMTYQIPSKMLLVLKRHIIPQTLLYAAAFTDYTSLSTVLINHTAISNFVELLNMSFDVCGMS